MWMDSSGSQWAKVLLEIQNFPKEFRTRLKFFTVLLYQVMRMQIKKFNQRREK